MDERASANALSSHSAMNGTEPDAVDASPVATEEDLIQNPPLPHERVLYWGSGSPQAWRVLIALEEKDLPYRSVCISFSSKVLKTSFFAALNPRMRVPVLVEPMDDVTPTSSTASSTSSSPVSPPPSRHSGFGPQRIVLYESGAILEYLCRRFPSPACMPRDLSSFATAQTRLHEANEILSVVGDLVVYLRRFIPEKRNVMIVEAKWAALEAELTIWESYLDGRPYLVSSNDPYLCDFSLFTNLAYAVRCGLQLDGLYPRLAMFYKRMSKRPSVEKTWPPHWKQTTGATVLSSCLCCSGKPRCTCCESLCDSK